MFNHICSADFHQGAQCLPTEARGQQCVPICLMFLFTVHVCSSALGITTQTLNEILFAGSYLYCAMLKIGSTSGFTDPTNLPRHILYKDKLRKIVEKAVFSGFMGKNSRIDECNFFSLEQAFFHACTCGTNFILVVKDASFGIHYSDSVFYVFDSHSRNKQGMNCSNGHCVYGSSCTVFSLCSYLRTLNRSLNVTEPLNDMQFDLHVFAFSQFRRNFMEETVKILNDGFKISQSCKRPNPAAEDLYNDGLTKMKKQRLGHKFLSVIEDINLSFNREKNIVLGDCTGSSEPNVDQQRLGHKFLSVIEDAHLSLDRENGIVLGDGTGICESDIDTGQEGCVDMNGKKTPGDIYNSQHIQQILEKRRCGEFTDDVHVTDPHSEIMVSHFTKLVNTGPNYVCSCCTQMFFKHSVRNIVGLINPQKKLLPKYLTGFKSVDGHEWLCMTCWTAVKAGKTPTCWLHNGLSFPLKPKELDLTNLEERLVCPRLPFMQLREMPRGGQINLKGNIVNVPADVNKTIKLLPRMVDETETIMLKLKRKMSYKHHVAFENIRPNKVFEAAKWLVRNSELFKNEGIHVDETWLYKCSGRTDGEENLSNSQGFGASVQTDDNWSEDDFSDRPTGNLDTYLQAIDFREFNQILSIAPGEGNTPIGLFQDVHSEALSFPSIFCGAKRVPNSDRKVPVHYSTICKWELRNVDRRAALCIPNIFFKLKRLQIKQIRDKVTLAIRKCKTKGQTFTAGDILSPGFVDKLTMQNDGYRVLRTIRGSPAYWEQAKRDVFAMIRQLGIPTWFCSFSAAETKWKPLLQTLSKCVNSKDFSYEELDNLTWQEKCILIKSDPVTCARYFDFRVQCFIKHVLRNKLNPIGEITDFFYRVEFQQRGSPHIHMLLWVKNAPLFEQSSDSEVSDFVDKYVLCSKDESISHLVNYQTHRHAKTCRKKGKAICRFNFPQPPMPVTTVLHPLDACVEHGEFRKKYEKVVACINDLYQKDPDLTFSDFLSQTGMDLEDYILAIRASLEHSKIFLKRSLSECRINNYNTTLMKCWQANMDLQFVMDPYACVSYIVSYISKGQRGLSNLLQDACHEANELDSDIRQQVRHIGNQFLSCVEIGAQEAAYLVLQMPLRRCTRDVMFVDTNKPNERTVLLKSMTDLKELPANSKAVEMDNVLKRYKRRPKSLETTCYADFCAWYDLCIKKKANENVKASDLREELPETDYEHDRTDDFDEDVMENNRGKEILFQCGVKIRKRSTQKVIYYHTTPINKDREEHFREKIMLYSHWRNEEELIARYSSFEDSFRAKHDMISQNRANYEKLDGQMLNDLVEVSDHISNDDLNPVVHAEGQHLELIDSTECCSSSNTFSCFDPGRPAEMCTETYDIGQDLGVGRKQISFENLPNKEIENDKYLESVRCLNVEQKQFFYHILHKVKTGALPFYTFLSGGAGVGKSVVIRALHQAILKYSSHLSNENPSTLKVLLCAPTGKAAHNIGGNTVHSTFCIPVSQGFRFKPLDMQQLNTLRSQFHDLRIIVIDEISMVGRGMLNFINLRLQEVMGTNRPFGGVSILAVGDLYQLKPVADSWMFSQVYASAHLGCLSTNLWVELFDFFELEQVMRQKDDHEFALLLNRLREGKHTDGDIKILKSRHVDILGISNSDILHIPHLFCQKANAIAHNASLLSEMNESELVNIRALDTVSGDLNGKLRDKILSKIPDDPSRTMGLQTNLILGREIPCEMCLNIDTADGLTNGAACLIKKFDFRVENSNRCSIVWVLFENKSIGCAWRRNYRHLFVQGIPPEWTPILETTRQFTIQFFKTYLITRRQFPLGITAGKTIHKSQGSTLREAVVHFGNRKVDHAHYVGLSRVTSLTGIYILELNCGKISISNEVAEEMERLRAFKKLTPHSFPRIQMFSSDTKICFQNCRSLQKHFDDIKNEQVFLNADVIGFVETRVGCLVESNPRFHLDDFKVVGSTPSTSSHGMVVYYRHNCKIDFYTFEHIECAVVQRNALYLCFIYCPPSYATVQNYEALLGSLIRILPSFRNVVLIGDFNFNFCPSHPITKFFEKMHFSQLITGPTTDNQTTLDHAYVNFDSTEVKSVGIQESYYSDHKVLFLVVPLCDTRDINQESLQHCQMNR